jgi:hypothetical protein
MFFAVCPAFQFREADGSVSLLVSVAVVPLLLSPTLTTRRLNCLQNKTKYLNYNGDQCFGSRSEWFA